MINPNTQTSEKTTRYVVLGVLVVILLAAAAFVGGSLLRGTSENTKEADFQIVAAEGLPKTAFELVGEVALQEGNSLYVHSEGNQVLPVI